MYLIGERIIELRDIIVLKTTSFFSLHNVSSCDCNSHCIVRNLSDDQSLFIGDLSLDITEHQVRQMFVRYGKIVYVDIHCKSIRDNEQHSTLASVGDV